MSDPSGMVPVMPDDDSWIEIRDVATRRKADEYALVLVAAGIDCRIARAGERYGLLVTAAKVDPARRELASYEEENSGAPRFILPARPLRDGVAGTLLAFCALLFLHGAASRMAFSVDWVSAGAANAGLILAGEWWRALTALGLHADLEHLASNLVAGSLLGIVLSQMLGGGLAWMAIVLAGGLGNGLNALFQAPEHTGIGASTAVFGAVGLIAALMTRYQRSLWRVGYRRWLPLGVGVMLLAFLGIEGERIDVGAHLGGFVAGLLLGVGLLALGQRAVAQHGVRQAVYGAAAIALFAGAWLIALGRSGP